MKIYISIKKLFFLSLLVFIGLLFSNVANAQVWTTENQWSDEWETKYQEWLRTKTNSKMFATESLADGTLNPYYGIRTDCADLVYTLRIIFSFENKLPFAMKNPANEKGRPVTNLITRYNDLESGTPRLRAFLTWLYDVVGSSGIHRDTYPIAFKDVVPGTVIVTSKKNHHSWTITDITKNGNPRLLFNSSTARESGFEVQTRRSWPNPAWVFEAEVDLLDVTKIKDIYVPGSLTGLRRWIPVEHTMAKTLTQAVPGYSDEQFLVGVGRWKTTLVKMLSTVPETMDQAIYRLLSDACSDLVQRVQAINEGELYKTNLAQAFADQVTDSDYIKEYDLDNRPDKPADRRCMIYKSFDTFSTPSRDRRLLDALMQARVYFQHAVQKNGEKSLSPKTVAIYKTIFPHINKTAVEEAALQVAPVTVKNFCRVNLSPKLGSISLAEVKRRLFHGKLSPNPNDSFTGRFGFARTEKDLGSSCPPFDLSPVTVDLNKSEGEALKELQLSLAGS